MCEDEHFFLGFSSARRHIMTQIRFLMSPSSVVYNMVCFISVTQYACESLDQHKGLHDSTGIGLMILNETCYHILYCELTVHISAHFACAMTAQKYDLSEKNTQKTIEQL